MTAKIKTKRITDKQIKMFLWEAEELPYLSKASYLLGDLTDYGVSCCWCWETKYWKNIVYEFHVYRKEEFRVALILELPIDFTLRDIERTIIRLWEKGGFIVSDDTETCEKWRKEIKPIYHYDHARYSAMIFLEALRKTMMLKKSRVFRRGK